MEQSSGHWWEYIPGPAISGISRACVDMGGPASPGIAKQPDVEQNMTGARVRGGCDMWRDQQEWAQDARVNMICTNNIVDIARAGQAGGLKGL